MHAAAGGVGSLAVQLGHPFGAGRVIATRLERGEARARARAGRRRRDRPRARGAHRAPARGQRGRAGWTSCSRCPAARCSTPPTRRWRRSGGSCLRDRDQRAERGLDRLAAAPLARGGRLLAVPLPGAAGHVRRRPRGPVRARRRAASCGRSWAIPIRSPRRAQAHIDLRARRTTGKLLLDPPSRERSDARQSSPSSACPSRPAGPARRRLRVAEPDPGTGDPGAAGRAAT